MPCGTLSTGPAIGPVLAVPLFLSVALRLSAPATDVRLLPLSLTLLLAAVAASLSPAIRRLRHMGSADCIA
jgi:hypothetical protein